MRSDTYPRNSRPVGIAQGQCCRPRGVHRRMPGSPQLQTEPAHMSAPKRKGPPPMTDRHVADLSHKFKLLADVSRLKILMALARDGETHVSSLCDMLGQSQPAVSHHLTLLRSA